MQQPPRTLTTSVTASEHLITEQWADEPELISQHSSSGMATEMVDYDMDMMDTSEPGLENGQSGTQGPSFFGSGKFQPEHTGTSVTGRIPTPIHCTFAAQLRGNNWNEAPGNVMQHVPLATTPEEPSAMAFCNSGMADISSQTSNLSVHENIPRCLDGAAAASQAMADWNMVQNRRLPSPISESGGEDGLDGSQMTLDGSSRYAGAHHLSHLTHQHPLIAGIPQREATPVAESPNGNGMDVESPGTPSPKRGHTRSRHTVNSWTTLQPGMKRSFSIGYRSDCEKCRMKVPGHFNHIIIS